MIPYQLEKLRQRHVVFAKEGAISGAAVHQVRIHFAAEFDAGFDYEAWKPGNAIHLGGFCGEFVHGHDASCGFSVEHVEKIVPANGRHVKSGFVIEVIILQGVVHEIEKFLRGAAYGGEKSRIPGREHCVG